MTSGQRAPESTVLRIVSIITHHKIVIIGNGDGTKIVTPVQHNRPRFQCRQLVPQVRFIESHTVNVNLLSTNLKILIRKTDDALYEVPLRFLGILENQNVATPNVRFWQYHTLKISHHWPKHKLVY
jgi:hypothetical protein